MFQRLLIVDGSSILNESYYGTLPEQMKREKDRSKWSAWYGEMLHNKEIDMVVNIPKNLTAGELDNGYKIRRAAIDLNIPLITNARLASAFINAFCTMSIDDIAIKSWEEYK